MEIKNNNSLIRPFWLQTFMLFMFLLPVAAIGGIYDYYSDIENARNEYSEEQIQVEKQISEAISILDAGQKFIEKSIDVALRRDLEEFARAYQAAGSDPSKINLAGLRSSLGENKDLYIVDDRGIIQYTTRREDLGLDFNKWNMGEFIDMVRKGDKYYSSRIEPAFVSGVIRKFAYLPSPDHKYTLEIGVDIEADRNNVNSNAMLDIASRLDSSYPGVMSIRMFNRECFLLGSPEYRATPEEKKLLVKARESGAPVVVSRGSETIKYLPVDLGDAAYATDPSMVVEIKSTSKLLDDEIKRLSVSHAAMLAIMMLIIIVGVYMASLRVANPVKLLIEHVSEIAEGKSPEPVSLKTNNELRRLEESINEMSRQIKLKTDELVERNETLTQEIALRERTEKSLEESNRQLLQAQKMEAIGLLAGGIAHDFNNMLGVIMGAAQLAQEEIPPDSPARVEFESICLAVDRARDLTQKLLTFSRKEKIVARAVSISTILNDLNGMLLRAAPKNIIIDMLAIHECVINCDKNQIQQMLVNLCNNAIDAMPEGGRLTIEAFETTFNNSICGECGSPMDGRYCLIQISDTGTGIQKEIIPRVTEPFFTTKEVGKGTGLGLSVSHGIILSHGGHIHIYSEQGKGTCVKVFLPAEAGPADIDSLPAIAAAVAGTETILVVDDETLMLNTAARMLRSQGYKTIIAPGGAEAVELYKKHRDEIAVVALDIMMPGMDGTEVNRKLKELNPDIKVVYTSGFSFSGVAGKLMKDKHRKFVQKPFEISALCGAVRTLIDEA